MAELFLKEGDTVQVDPDTACDEVRAKLVLFKHYRVVETCGMLVTLDTGYKCNAWYLTRLTLDIEPT